MCCTQPCYVVQKQPKGARRGYVWGTVGGPISKRSTHTCSRRLSRLICCTLVSQKQARQQAQVLHHSPQTGRSSTNTMSRLVCPEKVRGICQVCSGQPLIVGRVITNKRNEILTPTAATPNRAMAQNGLHLILWPSIQFDRIGGRDDRPDIAFDQRNIEHRVQARQSRRQGKFHCIRTHSCNNLIRPNPQRLQFSRAWQAQGKVARGKQDILPRRIRFSTAMAIGNPSLACLRLSNGRLGLCPQFHQFTNSSGLPLSHKISR